MDERTRYFRRLRRLRGSARRWSVLGGGLSAAAAVLTPYSGIGIADAVWAGAAGASVALAWWRWSDHRELAALPAPPAPDPALAGSAAGGRDRAVPGGPHRPARGAPPEGALRAARLRHHQGLGPARPGLGHAGRAGRAADRRRARRACSRRRRPSSGCAIWASGWPASSGRIPLSPADKRAALQESHAGLAAQFTEGVTAYERLVAAAASYVAEDGHPVGRRAGTRACPAWSTPPTACAGWPRGWPSCASRPPRSGRRHGRAPSAARLAARAPVGDPVVLVGLLDRGAAAAARLRPAAVDVAGLAAAQ